MEAMSLDEVYASTEPVWIEHKTPALSMWGLYNDKRSNMITLHFNCISDTYAVSRILAISEYGKNWTCYKHKPRRSVFDDLG